MKIDKKTDVETTEETKYISELTIRGVVWLGLIALVCFFSLAGMMVYATKDFNVSIAGSVGDFLGGMLNPIVALLGIMLLAMTLRQNSTALRFTQIELEKSTAQMKISAQALQQQEDLMRTERRESLILKISEKIQDDYIRHFADPNAFSIKGTVNSKADATESLVAHLNDNHIAPNMLRLIDKNFGQDHLYFHTIRKLAKSSDDFKIDDDHLMLAASIINTNYLLVSALIIHHRMVNAESTFVHFDDDRVYDMLLQMIKIAGVEQLWNSQFYTLKNY